MSVGKLVRYGLPFSNVVATGTATNTVTPGRTIEQIQLKLGGTALTKAMITTLKIKANGKVIIDTNGADLDKINAYRFPTGLTLTDTAFLDIQFADYEMLNEIDRMVGAFDTSMGIQNITSEVTITGATAPILTPILTESAQQRDPGNVPQGYAPLISKLLQYPFAMATGGTLPVTVPFGPQSGSIIKRLHVFHGGNMTGATVKQDGLVVHESLRAENDYLMKKMGNTPQTNVYTIDFVADGNIKKALDTRDARSLEWLFTFSAADVGRIYVEYLDPLGNL